MTSIKVKYKNDIRRVTLPEPLSFAKLREIIGVLYRSTQLPSNFVVKYVDDENDHISITSDIELEEACACAKRSNSNILRMFISEPNSEGKPEELPLRRDFDVHPQQTTVVTQSQLVSIEQILNSKETLSQQQLQLQQEQQKQLEEQKRQAEEQRQFLQQQQQLEQQRLERLRQLEQQQLEQQRLEQQRLQQQLEQERQRELEQQRLQEEQQKREQLEQQRLQEEQLKREQELALQRQAEKGQYMAVFVEDVGIQDGAIFAPGVEFEKVWRLKNTGTAPWPTGTQLAFKVGDKLSGTTEVFPVAQLAQPGETVNISAALRSPTQPGRYIAYFRLIAPDGSHFGHRIWADIVVEESRMDIDLPQQTPPSPQPHLQSPLQTNTPRSPLNAELENAIDQMVCLGFADRSVNAEALRKASGSLEEAINLLLDGQRFY